MSVKAFMHHYLSSLVMLMSDVPKGNVDFLANHPHHHTEQRLNAAWESIAQQHSARTTATSIQCAMRGI
jgi:hypothetical protein